MLSLIASIGAFLPGLFGKELSYKAAKLAGIAILGVLAFALLTLGKYAYDASVINEHAVEREVSAGKAREKAADERLADTITNMRNEEELHDVIEAAPKGGELSPAALALSCERLRRVGRIPPACRSASGN